MAIGQYLPDGRALLSGCARRRRRRHFILPNDIRRLLVGTATGLPLALCNATVPVRCAAVPRAGGAETDEGRDAPHGPQRTQNGPAIPPRSVCRSRFKLALNMVRNYAANVAHRNLAARSETRPVGNESVST